MVSNCLYNDEQFHIQDFKADGPRLPEVLKMMDNHVCRTTLMGLAITVAHDPADRPGFSPVHYTQTDGQVLYYNAIQGVLVAHKFLALPEQSRERIDPLINAFNLKDDVRESTSRRWSIYIRAPGAALAKSTSRNRSSPKNSLPRWCSQQRSAAVRAITPH